MEPPARQEQPQWSQNDFSKPSPAGENAMNVVMVGAECAPWSKTGALQNATQSAFVTGVKVWVKVQFRIQTLLYPGLGMGC